MRKLLKIMKVRPSDDGLSLIEVLVAMFIFSMLVVGIGYSLLNILKMTHDSQARETAISLASSELDAVRAIGDPFKVGSPGARTVTVGTNTYTITRTAKWASPDGSVDTCGTGDQPLQYKTVSVTVSWGSMGSGPVVQTDTALVPTSRINNPTLGTILVSVQDEAGLGVAGVTFTAKSSAGSLDTTPTNADGCAFLLGVDPGDYTVKLTSSNYMDITQSANPALVRTVEAGSSGKFSFQYDKRGIYKMSYASNDTDSTRPRIPNNLTTTFFNTNGRYVTDGVAMSSLQGSINLYPAQTGYEIVAGSYVPVSGVDPVTGIPSPSCESVDPAAWAEDSSQTPATIGTRAPTAYAPPGGTSAVTPVPMGVLTVKGNNGDGYLFAVSQTVTPLAGQPACDVATLYSFGYIFSSSSTTTQKVALPFGSWRLYVSNDSGSPSSLPGHNHSVTPASITLLTPGQMVGTDDVFVLDPRGVTP